MKTTKEMPHTPTPWKLEWVMDERRPIGKENAAFIVRAVNSHEELLDVAYTMLPYIEDLIEIDPAHHCYKVDSLRTIKKRLLATIAKAEGK